MRKTPNNCFSFLSFFLFTLFLVIVILGAISQKWLFAQISVSGTDAAKIIITVHMCGAGFQIVSTPPEIVREDDSTYYWQLPDTILVGSGDRAGTSSGLRIENTKCATLKFAIRTISPSGRWHPSYDTTNGVDEYVLWALTTGITSPSPEVPGAGEVYYFFPNPDSNIVTDTFDFISSRRFYNPDYDTLGAPYDLRSPGMISDEGLLIPAMNPDYRFGDMFLLHFMFEAPIDDSHGYRWRVAPDGSITLVDTVAIQIIGAVGE